MPAPPASPPSPPRLALAAPAPRLRRRRRHGELPAGAKVSTRPSCSRSRPRPRLRARIEPARRVPARPAPRERQARPARARARQRAAPLAGAEPAGPGARMFGNEAAYAVKRDRILGRDPDLQRDERPALRRPLRPARALRAGQHGAALHGCGGAVYNGAYCRGVNTIGWSMTWTADAFAQSGDMKWATLIAHEYGHAAQRFLGIRGGWMQYTPVLRGLRGLHGRRVPLVRPYNRHADTVGRGDYNEFRDAFVALQSTVDEPQHARHVRLALRTRPLYGWNTGFDGCASWARSIDGV